MFWRSNKGKNKPVNKPDNGIKTDADKASDAAKREAFIAENEEARKMYESIMSLRKSVESLKLPETEKQEKLAAPQETPFLPAEPRSEAEVYMEETEAIIAAKQAILEQARRDAMEQRAKREEAIRKEREALEEQRRLLETQRRVAMIEEEAERKRQEAIEAERRAKEVSRKVALEAMEAERQEKLRREAKEKEKQEKNAASTDKGNGSEHQAAQQKGAKATPEEAAAFFDERLAAIKQEADLEAAKNALLYAQKEQNVMLNHMSHATETNMEILAEEQHVRFDQQQRLIKEEQDKLESMLGDFKNKRLESVEREHAERALREQKALVEKLIREQNIHAARSERLERVQAINEERRVAKEERLAKAQRRREEKIRRAEEKERLRRAKKEAAEQERLRRQMLEEKSKADAELGGGVVSVQGVTINTAIRDVPKFSWRDVFGLKAKEEWTAVSEDEKRELHEERVKRTEEARAYVEQSLTQQAEAYQKSTFGRKVKAFKVYCDTHKVPLLTVFAIIIMAAVGTAGVFNYYTAYSYSYNGKTLGVVKEKDDVLRITDLVQSALTEDKNVDVVIDAKEDIEFERVATLDGAEIDSSEDVLKRLTYMGDLNVKAFGIYVNEEKVGAVESKEAAAEVLQDIKDKYTSHMDGAQIEEAVIIESVDVRKGNTDLQDIASKDEMVDILCTSGQKETLHTVVEGETLADVCRLYSMTEKDVLEDNEGVDPRRLTVGSTLVIRQNAPILTVKITEKVTYEEKVEYEVQEKKSEDIYEGYEELKQEGENGLNEITSRIVLVNGEQIEEDRLDTNVKKAPVPEIILVGAKERPPTVGSGKYIWPIESGYTLTSPFGYRWGRLHAGIDLGTSTGNNILAADGGTVTYAGYSGAYGYLVIIDHQNGMETRYAHNSSLLVSEGDKVFQGQHIAESGNTGRSTGPHLHFEIRVGGDPKDPTDFLP